MFNVIKLVVMLLSVLFVSVAYFVLIMPGLTDLNVLRLSRFIVMLAVVGISIESARSIYLERFGRYQMAALSIAMIVLSISVVVAGYIAGVSNV
jgi:hypothetical protein